jgi:predicted amidohydrolase
MFKLALVQMAVEGGDKWGNLRHAEELIDEACGNGARVVVLPEAVGLGWTDPAAKTEAETIPDGATCRMLGQAARRHGAFVCAGTVERENGAVFNSAVIVDPGGKVVLRHRKLNELDIGFQFYGQGDRLSVCRTELATFGLMICADAFARDFVVSRALGYMGADVILSPCSWAVPADHDNVKDPYGKLWRDS